MIALLLLLVVVVVVVVLFTVLLRVCVCIIMYSYGVFLMFPGQRRKWMARKRVTDTKSPASRRGRDKWCFHRRATFQRFCNSLFLSAHVMPHVATWFPRESSLGGSAALLRRPRL